MKLGFGYKAKSEKSESIDSLRRKTDGSVEIVNNSTDGLRILFYVSKLTSP